MLEDFEKGYFKEKYRKGKITMTILYVGLVVVVICTIKWAVHYFGR